jgi:2-dehydropantoate 2-reductase
MAASAKIAVWGAGAIGGTVGAHLVRAGHEVLFIDRAADHVAAIRRDGLAITGPIIEFRVKSHAVTPAELQGPLEKVLLCVKAQDTRGAAEQIRPHLAADGYVVSLQNGLNELAIAQTVGVARTIGAFINFGADYMEPGVVHYGGRGTVVVGEIDGTIKPRTEELHAMLLQFDDRAKLTTNVWGFLWSKLAYGALLFATALTNESIADCFAMPRYRSIFIELAREVAAVALADDVKLEPFDGFDPRAFMAGATLAQAMRSIDDLVAFNRRSAKTHSGIWRDLAVRKRRTEGDAQLGQIVRVAAERGVGAPITTRLLALIKSIEDGQAAMGTALLDALADTLPSAAAS